MPESPPPETLAWLHQSATVKGSTYSQVLLHLLERVEALEQRPTCKECLQVPPTPEAAPVATDEQLWGFWCEEGMNFIPEVLRACYNLGRQHGAAQPPAAQPAPPAAPAGGLVERVGEAMERHHVMGDIEGSWDAQARAAIREVAAWLDSNACLPDDATPREADGWEMAAQILNREADR
jgi:hypothetical protein